MRWGVIAALAFLLVSCSTHYTTARPEGDRTPIYLMTDAQALEVAHRALLEVFPHRKIKNLEGPVWGFSTKYRMLLDTYSQQVLVIPMEGLDPAGRMVRGFTFDVSGSGTAVISGSSKNRSLLARVNEFAASAGTRVLVESARAVSFRPSSDAAADAPAESSSVKERLRELRDLRDDGLITEEQFEAKQRGILGDL